MMVSTVTGVEHGRGGSIKRNTSVGGHQGPSGGYSPGPGRGGREAVARLGPPEGTSIGFLCSCFCFCDMLLVFVLALWPCLVRDD
jgi:hypothetical protein